WWRGSLKRLAESVEDAASSLSDKTLEDEGAASPEVETVEEISASIEALKERLSSATTIFYCSGSYCRSNIWWFPDFIRHGSSEHNCCNMEDFSARLEPLERDGQELVKKLLSDLKLDPETVKVSHDIFKDQSQKRFLCTRCDERVAKYMTFTGLVEHYLKAQNWHDKEPDLEKDTTTERIYSSNPCPF
ncbi:hypothetical protein FRC00_004504, partial [Tulasnella sp. 408]